MLCFYSDTKESTFAHLSHLVTTYMLCNTVHTLTVLLKIFRNNFCRCVVIMPEEVYEHADEGLKYKKQRRVIFLLEKAGVLCKLDRGMTISVDILV